MSRNTAPRDDAPPAVPRRQAQIVHLPRAKGIERAPTELWHRSRSRLQGRDLLLPGLLATALVLACVIWEAMSSPPQTTAGLLSEPSHAASGAAR